MPNLNTHLKFGVITYPLFLFLYLFLYRYFFGGLQLSTLDFAIGYILYLVGSDLPDLDSNNAPLRLFVKGISISFGIYVFTPFFIEQLTKFSLGTDVITILAVSISMIISASIINTFLSLQIFSHRGFAHSITFAGIYGLLIYLFTFGKEINSIFLGFSAFSGVMIHMILDYWKKPLKIFKLY